jgi:hypothetical protein
MVGKGLGPPGLRVLEVVPVTAALMIVGLLHGSTG